MAGTAPRYVIRLTEEQYGNLKKLSRSRTEPWIEVQRARILVSAHEHPDWSNHKIAGQVGCRADMVKKCRRHWQRNPSVKSLPPPRFSPEVYVIAAFSNCRIGMFQSWRTRETVETPVKRKTVPNRG